MRTLLHKTERGHLGQHEDWWYLVMPEGEEPYVEHQWDHVGVGSGSHTEGETKMSVQQALVTAPGKAVDRLREILGR